MNRIILKPTWCWHTFATRFQSILPPDLWPPWSICGTRYARAAVLPDFGSPMCVFHACFMCVCVCVCVCFFFFLLSFTHPNPPHSTTYSFSLASSDKLWRSKCLSLDVSCDTTVGVGSLFFGVSQVCVGMSGVA